MARGVNKVILIGNCGQDPETRYTANGVAITNVSVATTETWKDKQTGQPQERTEWHRVSFFNRLAEIAGEYLRKGSKVYIEGSIRTRKWQDQNGQDRYSTDIIANEMQMLDSRSGGEMQGGYAAPANVQPAPQQGHMSANPAPPPASNMAPPAPNVVPAPSTAPPPDMDSFDDDIPF